jgi:hypothetical protein
LGGRPTHSLDPRVWIVAAKRQGATVAKVAQRFRVRRATIEGHNLTLLTTTSLENAMGELVIEEA